MSNPCDILLAVLPPWGVLMPHMGIASLDSYLRNKGYATDVLDLNISIYNAVDKNYRKYWHCMENFAFWTDEKKQLEFKNKFYHVFEKILIEILISPPPVMAFSINSANQLITVLFVHEIRKRGYTGVIVFGGPACSQNRDSYVFKDTADVFVVGEGEQVLVNVMDMIYNGTYHLLETLPGVMTKEAKCNFVQAKPCNDPDVFGFPDFKNFDLSLYHKKILPVVLGRGCISKCAFCNDSYICGSFRGKKPESVVKELIFHVKHNDIKEFFFSDLLINADIKQLEEICDLIIASSLKIKWEAQCLIRDSMTLALFRKMKKAGCFALAFGVESFCDKTLKNMRKPFNSEMVFNVLKNSAKAGIYNKIGVIVGFPGETDTDFDETIAGIYKNASSISMISSIAPCLVNENSDLYNNSNNYGISFLEKGVKYYDWNDNAGNTYEKRKQKVKTVLNVVSKLGIKQALVNIYDKEVSD